ncbi:hypothetical protein DFP73DRAFT_375787 [Morchella snyderi]|nr:hypothetical protein DFP73DRAFT_375787 [Morchella snyderi]
MGFFLFSLFSLALSLALAILVFLVAWRAMQCIFTISFRFAFTILYIMYLEILLSGMKC